MKKKLYKSHNYKDMLNCVNIITPCNCAPVSNALYVRAITQWTRFILASQ